MATKISVLEASTMHWDPNGMSSWLEWEEMSGKRQRYPRVPCQATSAVPPFARGIFLFYIRQITGMYPDPTGHLGLELYIIIHVGVNAGFRA